MRKRVFLIVGALAAALSVSIGAVAVMGQESSSDTDDSETTIQSFVSRVAENLELDEDTVQDAFDEARDDLKEDLKAAHRAALEEKLEAAVEDGEITQDQMDEYLEWYDDKPDDLGISGSKGGHHGGFGFGRHGGWK